MLKSVEGIFKDGKVELLEKPADNGTHRVIVTFLPSESPIDLREIGIGEDQAADLRARLKPFAEDWDRPDMDVYDAV